MNKIIALVGLVVVIGAGVWVYTSPSRPSTEPITADETAASASIATPTATAAVKEFTVTGQNFSFSPNIINVKKGDLVRITFKNASGFHDLRIDEFNAATRRIAAGAEETIEFTADKTGAFEYYCSVGNHRAMGMKGTLTVTE